MTILSILDAASTVSDIVSGGGPPRLNPVKLFLDADIVHSAPWSCACSI